MRLLNTEFKTIQNFLASSRQSEILNTRFKND